ncbi:uncharacterized protein Ir94d [Drosophila kikkawai]|uniref:Uncharacterized protein Ir94d n=1 Tax=Drosophila kikkawai TaxID=30033 RepID=A0A6P4J4M4_DROKI|nr:uncharacterized protein LOC108080214 [Drosophila kikkawai]
MGQLHLLLATFVLLSPGGDCSYRHLLPHLSRELNFEFVVLLGNSDPIWQKTLFQLPVPIIQINEESKENYHLGFDQSKNFLTIVFVHESSERILDLLHVNLGFLNTLPVLMVLEKESVRVYPLFEWCWHHQLLNVVAVGRDFEKSQIIYSYSPFPILQFIERRLENSTLIFESHLEDLQGYSVPIALGGSSPRLIVYRGSDGQLIFSGPVGNLMKCFEQRYNCKMVQPYPFNKTSIQPARQLIGAVRNGSVQFALAAIYPDFPFSGYTYPIELMSWCLMMPVPSEVPHSLFYSLVFDPLTFWLTILVMVVISLTLSLALRLHGYRASFTEHFLHDSCLRGVLAQPFYEVLRAPALVRGIYMVICVLGILITAWYNSYFSTFVTSAPRQAPFTSYESIEHSNVEVVIWKPEYEKLIQISESMRKYTSIFRIKSDYQEFLQLRDSFDTRYGYMMPLEKWSLIKEQQKVFSSPLFTLREDLCVYHTIPIVFPIADNSIFRQPLERLILDVTATGLLARWRDMALTEMVKAGQLQLVDRSQPKEFRAMKVEDLEQVWIAGGFMLGLATMVFIGELLWSWRNRLRRILTGILWFRNLTT